MDSNVCSGEVSSVVENMRSQIDVTTIQLEESVEAISASLGSLLELGSSFDGLTDRFDSLYVNIEEQNKDVQKVDSIFDNLREKVVGMSSCSKDNRVVVQGIIDSVGTYKEHMDEIIQDTLELHKLSNSMLDLSKEEVR